MREVNKRISIFAEFLESLRSNKRIPHMLFLGAAAVAGFGVAIWQVALFSSFVSTYIETHGWTGAMERIDQITAPLWKGTGK